VEVSAAGGHHLFLLGPPGCGKTMLAERLPALHPPLDPDAALEVTAIHSVAGVLPRDEPLVVRAPFQAPHHTATVGALVGGGSTALRPGAASLAHRGTLFLDEAPEFSPHALDALRQPLESGAVELARARASARFPARFTLVLAANPCPCGRPSTALSPCECPSTARRRYLARLSGPLLDRVDIRLVLGPVLRADLLSGEAGVEDSATVRARVAAARERQAHRYRGTPWRLNGEVPGAVLRKRWPLDRLLMRSAYAGVANGTLTARGLDRVLRLAWTLADLRGLTGPGAAELSTAQWLRDMRP